MIPVWIGGHADVALRRAAAIADGFMLELDLGRAATAMKQIDQYRAEYGRLNEAFGFSGRVHVDARDVAAGVSAALAWRALGITHLAIETMNAGVTGPRQHLEVAESFMNLWRKATSEAAVS